MISSSNGNPEAVTSRVPEMLTPIYDMYVTSHVHYMLHTGHLSTYSAQVVFLHIGGRTEVKEFPDMAASRE